MPRSREVTMGKVSRDQAHEAAIRLCLKKNKPYKIIAKHEFGLSKRREWMIIYQAGDMAKPVIVADRFKKRAKVKKIMNLLERAWAEGFYTSGMSGANVGS